MNRQHSALEQTSNSLSSPRRLNVGCGRNVLRGWINLDSQGLPGVDIIADLERCADVPLPLEDDSVDEFLLSHVIEHIRSPLPVMQELWRVARAGAKAVIRVPYGSSDDAWEDPTHVRAYFMQSFGYCSQPYYWRADYGYRGDWQPSELILIVHKQYASMPTTAALFEAINKYRNVVREMVATLIAVKPARLPQRELQELPAIRLTASERV